MVLFVYYTRIVVVRAITARHLAIFLLADCKLMDTRSSYAVTANVPTVGCVFVQMMSTDYETSSARWIITPDDIASARPENSSNDVFDRYTWTQFLQVKYFYFTVRLQLANIFRVCLTSCSLLRVVVRRKWALFFCTQFWALAQKCNGNRWLALTLRLYCTYASVAHTSADIMRLTIVDLFLMKY